MFGRDISVAAGWRRSASPPAKIIENAEGKAGTRRPVSRVLSDARKRETAIPLDRPSPAGSRDLPGPLGPATALPACTGARSLFGLAPGGACHAAPVTRSAVGSYPTLSPLPLAGRSAFCGAFPGVTPGGRYPPPCRRGARTFLDACTPRPPGRLIRALYNPSPLAGEGGPRKRVG